MDRWETAPEVRRSRLVRASQLPERFEIRTAWHCPAHGVARPEGKRVRVSILGATLLLRRSQRVRILT